MTPQERQSPRSREHAEMQRQRILAAAEQSFVEFGFHAASMACIAEKAEVSQGLAYRYFENKNAIILAIIERQIEERRNVIRSLQSEGDFIERILELFEAWVRRDSGQMNPVLFLEMSAEATRDPEIGRALREADLANRKEFTNWLKREVEAHNRKLDDTELATRALAIQAFVEGIAIRAVREPDIDRLALAASAGLALPRLLGFGASEPVEG